MRISCNTENFRKTTGWEDPAIRPKLKLLILRSSCIHPHPQLRIPEFRNKANTDFMHGYMIRKENKNYLK